MELRHLRYFLAVAKAAISARCEAPAHRPSLRSDISSLAGGRTRHAIVKATSRRVTLTEAGALSVWRHNEPSCRLSRLKEVAQARGAREVGTTRIGFSGSCFLRGKLAADLIEFKLAFPRFDIEITELPPRAR